MIPLRRFLTVFVIFAISLNVEAQINESEIQEMDIVFCLDLSGSTNGLIDNVRENIWGMINMVNCLKPAQKLRIGVIGFSRPSFGKSNFYVKILSPLTTDYDQVQVELDKLRSGIEKGDQFVSNALETARSQMKWAKSDKAVKIIFLIGNGSLSTGTTDYRSVADEIQKKGISLVPVYCLRSKPLPDEVAWHQLGRISGFDYEKIVVIKREPFITPLPDQKKIIALNKRLNQLMLPYTKEGLEARKNVISCDENAVLFHPVLYENRLFYRISDAKLQQTKKWDLGAVDLETQESLSQYDLSLLPDSIKTLPQQQLFHKILKLHTERAQIITEIKKMLPDDRQHFINGILKDGTFEKEQLLERVLLLTIKKIAETSSINLD